MESAGRTAMMLKLVKWIFIGLVVPVGFLAIALWSVFHIFPQEKLRTMAAVELGRRTNREAEIGPLHLSLGGLTIDSLRLSEAPNFRRGVAIDAKGVRLGWDLQSLWQGLNVKNRSITQSRRCSWKT